MPAIDSVRRDGWQPPAGEVPVDAANKRPGRRWLERADQTPPGGRSGGVEMPSRVVVVVGESAFHANGESRPAEVSRCRGRE
jgi:hypothetical protein